MLNEEKDAPVAAMKIAVPVASVRKKKKITFYFSERSKGIWLVINMNFIHLSFGKQRVFLKKNRDMSKLVSTYKVTIFVFPVTCGLPIKTFKNAPC
jgi:hypothetical protein